MIWAVVIFLLAMAAKLAFDVRLYLSGKPNKHIMGAAFVSVVIAVCTWLAGWWSLPMWLFVWWAGFDLLWNVLTGNDIGHIGTTAKLDILQRRFPALVWVKYGGAIGSIILYVLVVVYK